MSVGMGLFPIPIPLFFAVNSGSLFFIIKPYSILTRDLGDKNE
jgi:hypothetical protein